MKYILLGALLLLAPCAAVAAEPNSPKTIRIEDATLAKVGEGTFRWMLIKVYHGELYLDANQPTADPLSDVSKQLKISYAISLSDEDFRNSGNKILSRNLDPAEWDAIQERLQQLNAAYRNVEPGDAYTLTYIPGQGTTLALNEIPLVTIPGEDFARAYFSIWLGQDPVKASLRRDLLGY